MQASSKLLAIVLGSGFFLHGGQALAQESASAQALFDKGVSDMDAGRYDSGCPAIAESHRLEPRPGTLFALAECEAKWGRIASAVAHYEDYVGLVSRLPSDQQARHADRVTAARSQVTAIRPTVPTLTLILPPDAPTGTVVERDGVALQGAALGLALPMNPGKHTVVTRPPGKPESRLVVQLAPNDAKRIELKLEVSPANVVSPPPPLPSQPPVSNPEPSPATATSSRKTWAYVAGGVGLAGLAIGATTGLIAIGKKGTVDDNCEGLACNHEGRVAADSGKTFATVSTVATGVGIAGLAVGVVLLLTAPKVEQSNPTQASHAWQPLVSAAPRGSWVGVQRTF